VVLDALAEAKYMAHRRDEIDARILEIQRARNAGRVQKEEGRESLEGALEDLMPRLNANYPHGFKQNHITEALGTIHRWPKAGVWIPLWLRANGYDNPLSKGVRVWKRKPGHPLELVPSATSPFAPSPHGIGGEK
jgi:hypothetical protein